MNASQATYEFGPFCLDGNKKLLWRDREPVALTPKVLDTLLVLIELRDRVVTKDELLERVWSGTVVEEGGLARNISILRKALGEKPDQHTYIVTVPGKGYRFVADVREVAAIKPRVPRWLLLGGLAALAAGVLVVVYLLRPPPGAPAGQPAITSLAVLPLANLSGDPAQEYFADGMTDALIGNLARIRALRVVSRTSVMRFKGGTRSLPEIAQALNVDAIVEGSVLRTGDRDERGDHPRRERTRPRHSAGRRPRSVARGAARSACSRCAETSRVARATGRTVSRTADVSRARPTHAHP